MKLCAILADNGNINQLYTSRPYAKDICGNVRLFVMKCSLHGFRYLFYMQ